MTATTVGWLSSPLPTPLLAGSLSPVSGGSGTMRPVPTSACEAVPQADGILLVVRERGSKLRRWAVSSLSMPGDTVLEETPE